MKEHFVSLPSSSRQRSQVACSNGKIPDMKILPQEYPFYKLSRNVGCQVKRFYDRFNHVGRPSKNWRVEGITEERRIKPESIPELQRDIANTIAAKILRDVAQNMRKRLQAYIGPFGVLFKYFLKSF